MFVTTQINPLVVDGIANDPVVRENRLLVSNVYGNNQRITIEFCGITIVLLAWELKRAIENATRSNVWD